MSFFFCLFCLADAGPLKAQQKERKKGKLSSTHLVDDHDGGSRKTEVTNKRQTGQKKGRLRRQRRDGRRKRGGEFEVLSGAAVGGRARGRGARPLRGAASQPAATGTSTVVATTARGGRSHLRSHPAWSRVLSPFLPLLPPSSPPWPPLCRDNGATALIRSI